MTEINVTLSPCHLVILSSPRHLIAGGYRMIQPAAIAADSFAIIRRELRAAGHALAPPLADIVERIIHSTADFEFATITRVSPGAIEAGVRALQVGCAVVTDVRMVRV